MKWTTFDLNEKSTRYTYTYIFALSFVVALTLFLPHIIMDKGYFYFLGDYNVQQIPFNMRANEAVKNGNIFWSWTTDLGANFIGSYAFYLAGSPFFWIMLCLPTSLIPKALPWVLCLKFAVSSVTAYAYIKRFTKNKNYAFLGALMYSFSSFSIYSIFFNHFNDVIALFPLLLIGLEELMENNKRGYFAAAVFINALCNYYFFVAEVVFVFLYWLFRVCHKSWSGFNAKKFLQLVFESAAGFLLSTFIVLPAVLATMQIPRAGTKLEGWALLTYYEVQRYPQLIQAFFFPPELPSQLNFFPDAGGKWSSVTAWLPLFSMSGVLAWIRRPKKDWLSRFIILLVFMTFVPALNASFQLLSNSFYTRWFYMLVMMLSLATAISLEQCSDREFKSSILWTALISAAIALPVGLIKDPDKGKVLAAYPARLWIYVGIVAVCLICAYILMLVIKRQSKIFNTAAAAMLIVSIIGYGSCFMFLGVYAGIGDPEAYTEKYVRGIENINLPDLENVRTDVTEGESNATMFWGIPGLQAFHSIVPGSITEFYTELGIKRDVSSKPDLSHIPLRSLLSVKYLFDGKNRNDIDVYGFKKIDTQNTFGVWENENYIPFGFTYDKYISREDWDTFSNPIKESLLLKAIVLEDEDVKKYSYMFEKMDTESNVDTSNGAITRDAAARRAFSAINFERDKYGFQAEIELTSDNLVFFSIPYEPGWSAYVNGEKVDIVKANVGFMAVPCKAGHNDIRFNYMTPGLIPGIFISLTSLGMLLIYVYAPKLSHKKPSSIAVSK